MATDWGKFMGMRFIQIMLALIFVVLLIITGTGIFTNKHIKIGPIEFNGIKDNPEKSKPDTGYKGLPKIPADSIVTKQNPATLKPNYPPINTKQKPSGIKPINNVQNNDSGGSGVQNNAPNYGNQAGRDINNYGIIPREVKEDLIVSIMNQVPDKKTTIYIVKRSDESESEQYANKILVELRKRGYIKVIMGGTTKDPLIGAPPDVASNYQHTIRLFWENGYFNIIVPLNK